ncbi:PREDICTED: uncharacterized protein LOC104603386 [Nelumbo nucifera]|uniref:Uncharacterized protein LOC104603386 n=2 Tax=Nelumbo nucifera TaxID=4432 RepID=A0A1U8AIL6_NELNU|nr:PREDICTED: uncharacterized protein LOC104603386 [Nelumbo nucifera]DAD27322.1 TPA_asm: hypothetical protein HUJ06_028790 [Nelumbo nucifera]
MAFDQSSTQKDLRQLDVARTVAEEPRAATGLATGRNAEGFLPNSARDVGSPGSRQPLYYAATVPDTGYVGLGFANPMMAWCSRPPVLIGTAGAVPVGYTEFPNVGNRVGGNGADQASNEGGEESVSGKKVKFLCSFGGKILPRPSDGMLRYVGGQTRIIGVKRDICFQELVQKMTDIYGQSVHIKYQLPDEDLDALVSISCPEDIENMMEEYEKLVENSDGSSKLRLFLFAASEPDPSGLVHFCDLQDSGQRYVDAVNGIPDGVGCKITGKGSTASAGSTQNSDSLMSGGDGADSFGLGGSPSPGVLSPRVAVSASQESATRLVYVGPNPVVYTDASAVPLGHAAVLGVPSQSSSRQEIELERQMPAMVQQKQQQILGFDLQQSSGVEVPPSVTYMQPYADNHQEAFTRVEYLQLPSQGGYANPQMLSVAGSAYRFVDHTQQVRENTAGVPPHQFIPAVHMDMTMAFSSPYVGVKQNGVQQYIQPQQARVEPYPEESSVGQKVVQVPIDQNYKTYQTQPQPQLASVPLQAGVYDLNQVPPTEQVVSSEGWVPHQQGNFPDKTLRFEDCYMCQKALPHTHSDTLVQERRDNPQNTVSDSNLVFHSFPTEDNMRDRTTNRVGVTGALGEGTVEHQGSGTPSKVMEHVNPERPKSPLNVPVFAQNPEAQHDNERILFQKLDNPDNPRMLYSPAPGVMRFPGDVLYSDGVFPNNAPQSGQEDSLQQSPLPLRCQVKQEVLINKTAATDSPPARVMPYQTSQPLGHETITECSGKILGFVPKEDTSDTCISYDHLRPMGLKMEAICISSPEISGNNEQTRLPVNKPKMDEIPDKKPQIAGKEIFLANDFIKAGIAPDGNCTKPAEMLPVSSSEVVYLNNIKLAEPSQVAQQPTVGHLGMHPYLKNENSHISPDEIWHAFVPSGANAPSALSPPSGMLGDDWDSAPSNSLFSNQDPWILRHDSHFTPRLIKVTTTKEAFVTRDNGGDTSTKMRLNEGAVREPSWTLNKDTNSEHLQTVKGAAEEHIKKELQAVAEGVAASVFQPTVLSNNSDFSIHEINESSSEANQDREIQNNDAEAQSRVNVEDMKTKLQDKAHPGFPISDGIGRLQIIKNSDLEELRELGSGTFGTVYHGKWRGSDVAIKRINDRCFSGKLSEQERMRDDFWNEAIKLADLHHPNVVAFYGIVLDGPGGSVATVTEYMVNGSLRNALQKNDKIIDKRKRVLIAMDVAFGMEYLHGKNIVHFDLKSDNLLVNLRDPHRPICKVSDLGLSKVKCQTLISGGVRGTLPWMAPELLNGSNSLVSEKVDVFSFGIVMWELLTGEEPYADLHYGAIIGGIVSNTLRPAVPDYCDPEWRSLMEKCWSSETSERPSFTEIANMLRSMAANLPSKGQAQQQQHSTAQPQAKK